MNAKIIINCQKETTTNEVHVYSWQNILGGFNFFIFYILQYSAAAAYYE